MFSRLNAWLLRRLRRNNAAPPAIVATADGFTVRHPDGTAIEVLWTGVSRIAAYKRDLYATDEIMLLVQRDSPTDLLELSERWPGFSDLFAGMEQALGVSPVWYMEIMVPAFETTPRVLYERPGSASAPAVSVG